MNRVYHKIFSYRNVQPSKISLAYFIKKPDTMVNPSIVSNQLKREIEINRAYWTKKTMIDKAIHDEVNNAPKSTKQ